MKLIVCTLFEQCQGWELSWLLSIDAGILPVHWVCVCLYETVNHFSHAIPNKYGYLGITTITLKYLYTGLKWFWVTAVFLSF